VVVMARCEKLLGKAKASPNNLRFDEICKLAECHGWIFKRQRGSHTLYEHPGLTPEFGRRQNFQSDQGKAKEYQVLQLLSAIENIG
jgi:hypothetical protein